MTEATTAVAASGQTPGSDTDRVLTELSAQISSMRNRHASNGYTNWAIIAAIAGIMWLLLKELEAASPPWVQTAQLVLGLWVVADAAYSWLRLKGLDQGEAPREHRFQFANRELGQSRPEIAWWVLRSAVILAVTVCIHSVLPTLGLIVVLVAYSCALSMSLLALITSLLEFPIRKTVQPVTGVGAAIGFVLCSAVLLVLAASAVGVIWSWYAPRATLLAEVRTAGLVFAVLLLVGLLTRLRQPTPLLRTLEDTRRDLAFGHIDAQTAVRQAETALDGMRIDALLQDRVRAVLESCASLDRDLATTARELDALGRICPVGVEPPDERAISARTMARALTESMRGILAADGRLRELWQRTQKRVNQVTRVSGGAREVSDTWRVLAEAMNERFAAVNACKARVEEARARFPP